MDPIQAAIAAATAAAGNISQDANANMGLVPATVQGSTAVAMPTRGAPLGVDDMLTGSLNVTAWLKVNEIGLFIGTDNTPLDKITAVLDFSAVQYCYSIKYGNPAIYEKTYDRLVSAKQRPWADVVAQAQRIDPNASEFRSADLPFEVLDDIKNKKGEILVNAGESIGHSLSTTGWKSYQTLLQQASKAGLDIRAGRIVVDIEQETRKNAKGTWGVLKLVNPRPESVN